MALTLYWLQCGSCGGDSMSLLNLESPDLGELPGLLGLQVLWHPSLSNAGPARQRELLEALLAGEQPLDVLVVEGAVVRGPGGTGVFDTCCGGRPKKDIVARLARRARYVLAAGTCASFGGVGADTDIEATGLQFHRRRRGGFLGEAFLSTGGLPVINIPGCPVQGGVLAGTLAMLASGLPLELGPLQAPLQWYGMLVHQGCARNEYHEYRVAESTFGERGCLYFHLGCRGPYTWGPCNVNLWNRRSSKTRAGVPCFGCTSPDFPQPWRFFRTRAIAGVPIDLPDGVDRAHYLAYKALAAASAPERLTRRLTRV